MRLDPEEQIIAAAIERAEFDAANERVVWAQIEFAREGYARATITISRELVDKARALDWSSGKLFAEAIRIALPDMFNMEALETSPRRAA